MTNPLRTGVDPTLETLCVNTLQTMDFVQQNVCSNKQIPLSKNL